jgi:Mce-associated membrane protein
MKSDPLIAPEISDDGSDLEAAEAELIAAEQAAVAARARAAQLRARAALDVDVADADNQGADAPAAPDAAPPRRRRVRVPRKWLKYLLIGVGIGCTLALVGLNVWMLYQHHTLSTQLKRRAEYEAAARQSVTTLMSIDYRHAQQDVQRIIDNSTGSFKDDFQRQAPDLVNAAQQAHTVTEVTVNVAGVETATSDTATVLVSASTRVTNNSGSKPDPHAWRLAVDLKREGNQIKMTKVEFVP